MIVLDFLFVFCGFLLAFLNLLMSIFDLALFPAKRASVTEKNKESNCDQ